MSPRGAAPPLAHPVALLAPGDDVFFWVDRDGRIVSARRPIRAPQESASGLSLGVCAFEDRPDPAAFERYATVLEDTLDGIGFDTSADAGTAVLRGVIDADDDRARWRERVLEALAAIEGGAVSKIVLARSVRLAAESAIDARDLARSMLRAHGTYRYLLRRGEVVFAGASPERLVEKRGDLVRTEAVAGTAPAEHDGSPLEQREKDRREHLAVVLAIDETLAPQTLALEHSDEPLIRTLGPVSHLVTPFEGRVAPETHVLDLAAALHPTPAVAGTPRDVALEFIARHEPARGWYAGPIGWHDRNGDGELAVALRCVRIEGTAVEVFAGAGIVSGSDPDAEFDETTLKMRSTLASLGFETVA